MLSAKETIQQGKACLGIEFGSTRIKAILIDENHTPIASGSYQWENHLENGIWTYSMEEITDGLQGCYQDLCKQVEQDFQVSITSLAAIGFSAMMHGYLAFDDEGQLLTPFRTWRNNNTAEASKALTKLFDYNIPERWSIAHLYQAIQNGEEHVNKLSFLTTLAGFIHWKLTGQKVIGIGDASGMFPIDTATRDYDSEKMEQFEKLIAEYNYPWSLSEILPRVLCAGEHAGMLTEEGAQLLDVSGKLQAGIPVCPPEGDAGTGMTATNSVGIRTGNVSAGTSVFGMVVLEKPLQKMHPEIDLVTTPDGNLTAMVHANNCTSDINAWAGILQEFAEALGAKPDSDTLYSTIFHAAQQGEKDCGGLLSYGYLSGENITGISEGRPLFVRQPESHFTFANLARTLIYTAFGALKIGMDILSQEEHAAIDTIYGHGGLFTTKGVAQQILADAVNAPVAVMQTAGEGGPWGMAILASYMIKKQSGESLETYLNKHVFCDSKGETLQPDSEGVKGFEAFSRRYRQGIAIERSASECLSADN